MTKNKIECGIKSGHLEIDMSLETATNVLFALKGFYACARETMPNEELKKLRASQFVAAEFLMDSKIFMEICNEEFFEGERKIPGYEMFLTKVVERIQNFKK